MSKVRLLAVLAITMVAGLLVPGCKNPMGLPPDVGAAAGGWDDRVVFTLYGGQTIPVGTVTVWNTLDKLYIQYDMTGNWWLDETHVAVATTLASIPQKKGNPPPGLFEFKNTWNPRVQTCQYAIPFRAGWGVGCIFIATHAAAVQLDNGGNVVQSQTGWAGPNPFPGKNWATYIEYHYPIFKTAPLPTGTVEMFGTGVSDVSNSYWEIKLRNVSGVWDGPKLGWCAQPGPNLTEGTWLPVTLWSTAEPDLLPDRLKNANWDNVNYLLNNKPTDDPNVTAMDIQTAIWHLLRKIDYPSEWWPLAREMIVDAEAHGDGWYPTTGDVIAVILESPNPLEQLCIIEVDP